MASVQELGTVRVKLVKPSGQSVTVYDNSVTGSAPAGGSPDAASTSMPARDTLDFIPVDERMAIRDDRIVVTFEAIAADGIDVSDNIWQIPIVVGVGQHASRRTLTTADFTNPTPADYTTVAGTEVEVGGYTCTGPTRFGGGKLYIDFQDDT